MLSRDQQTLVDMAPGAVETINGRVVARDWRGWTVAADASCQNVQRCTSLPAALAAVQPEKAAPRRVFRPTAQPCECGWQAQAQRDFDLAASWKQLAETYRVDLEIERTRSRRLQAPGAAS